MPIESSLGVHADRELWSACLHLISGCLNILRMSESKPIKFCVLFIPAGLSMQVMSFVCVHIELDHGSPNTVQ